MSADTRLAYLSRLPQRKVWSSVGIVTAAVMELSVYVPLLWFTAVPNRQPGLFALLLWFGLIMLVVRTIVAALDRWGAHPVLASATSAGLLLVCYLTTINLIYNPASLFDLRGSFEQVRASITALNPLAPELLLLFWFAVIWRRALATLSPTLLEPGKTGLRFRLGVLAYAVIAVLDIQNGIPGLLPLFFFSGLVAMSLARVESISQGRGAGEMPFKIRWLASLTGLFLLTVLLGIATGRALDSRIAKQALVGLRLLFLGILQLILWLVSPLWRAVEPALNRIFEALQQFFEREPAPSVAEDGEQLFFGQPQSPPPFVESLTTWLAKLEPLWPAIRTGLILAIVLLLLLYAVRRAIPNRRGARGWGLYKDEGKALAASSRMSEIPPRIGGWLGAMRDRGLELLPRRLRTAIVARRVYAQLLKLANQKGRPRKPFETPLEFQAALKQIWPDKEAEIELITSTYQFVRYGEHPESQASAEEVNKAWLSIAAEAAT